MFDHILDHSKKEQDGYIDNGNDAYGPGIYTWVAEGGYAKNSVQNALRYSGDDGYVHFLTINVEEDELLNNLPSSMIDNETWEDIIDSFMEKRRKDKDWDAEKLQEILRTYVDDIESGNEIDITNFLESTKPLIDLDLDYYNPNDAEDAYQWIDEVLEAYEMEDPCSHIIEEGGSHALANTIPDQYEDLWSVICKMWELTAVNGNGLIYESYNASFIDACIDHVDFNLAGAIVSSSDSPDGSAIFVAFNPNELVINRVIKASRTLEKEDGGLSP